MVEDFQDVSDASVFLDELEAEDKQSPLSKLGSRSSSGASTLRGFMGLTPIQIFILSAMFFFIVCLIGFFFMMVTGKMVIP